MFAASSSLLDISMCDYTAALITTKGKGSSDSNVSVQFRSFSTDGTSIVTTLYTFPRSFETKSLRNIEDEHLPNKDNEREIKRLQKKLYEQQALVAEPKEDKLWRDACTVDYYVAFMQGSY